MPRPLLHKFLNPLFVGNPLRRRLCVKMCKCLFCEGYILGKRKTWRVGVCERVQNRNCRVMLESERASSFRRRPGWDADGYDKHGEEKISFSVFARFSNNTKQRKILHNREQSKYHQSWGYGNGSRQGTAHTQRQKITNSTENEMKREEWSAAHTRKKGGKASRAREGIIHLSSCRMLLALYGLKRELGCWIFQSELVVF